MKISALNSMLKLLLVVKPSKFYLPLNSLIIFLTELPLKTD